ncbi:hypothetical protein [Pseudomonas ovata]|uniref:hypothetical protein n=1 Tax=Pseudomonas ovata TaxID=1839709 RepID=UPI00129C0D2F|nr:hypothetical protein [Pseudomonas ovata]
MSTLNAASEHWVSLKPAARFAGLPMIVADINSAKCSVDIANSITAIKSAPSNAKDCL